LLFELINATPQVVGSERPGNIESPSSRTISETIEGASKQLADRWETLKAFLLALGDDVQMKILKHYIAFKRLQNFACVELRTQNDRILVYAKLDPETTPLEAGFTRDVRNIGHYGTGDLEITISSDEDFKRAQPLLIRSYESS
jgi:predicted transport protein